MRRRTLILLTPALLLALPALAAPEASTTVPGGIARVRLGSAEAPPAAYLDGQRLMVRREGGEWTAIAGVPLSAKVGARLKVEVDYGKLDDLAAMIVGYKDGAPVRLRDIAEIEDGLADFRQLARLNGKPAVGVGIVKVPNTNTVEIIDRVLERIEKDIRPQLPPGLELHIVQNDKIFIGDDGQRAQRPTCSRARCSRR